jgi:hypothetical protein
LIGAYCPRRGQRHKPSGNVYAISKEFAPFDDHIALVDADAQFDPLRFRYLRVVVAHSLLDTRSCLPHDISQARIPTTPYNLPSS